MEGPAGHRRGAVCAGISLESREEAQVTFTLAWHFPHMKELQFKGVGGGEIGHLYSRRFRIAADVVRWLQGERAGRADASRQRGRGFGGVAGTLGCRTGIL